MPERTTVNTVHVYRDGKVKVIRPGTVFNYTAEELADIKLNAPGAVRPVVNESSDETDEQRMKREASEQDDANANAVKEAKIAAEKAAAKNTPAAKTTGRARSADDL